MYQSTIEITARFTGKEKAMLASALLQQGAVAKDKALASNQNEDMKLERYYWSEYHEWEHLAEKLVEMDANEFDYFTQIVRDAM